MNCWQVLAVAKNIFQAFGKDVDDRDNLMKQRYFLLGEPESCQKEWLCQKFVSAWQLKRNQETHTERTMVN
jgi:hypothetical protein